MALLNGMAARMAAEATLRAAGGGSVIVCGATSANDDGDAGLGIGPAMQRQWELEPVLVRWKTANDEAHRELVVCAATIEQAFQTCDIGTLRSLLLRCEVKIGGETLRIAEISTEMNEGTVYLYRVRLAR